MNTNEIKKLEWLDYITELNKKHYFSLKKSIIKNKYEIYFKISNKKYALEIASPTKGNAEHVKAYCENNCNFTLNEIQRLLNTNIYNKIDKIYKQNKRKD